MLEKTKKTPENQTIILRLETLKANVKLFAKEFPKESKAFLERIERLKQEYNQVLEELDKSLTFSIDPDIDSGKLGEALKLEQDVERFMGTEVKFSILSNRLQRLITKLNILYNISILHFTSTEKQKVLSQLEQAREVEMQMVEELRRSDYLLRDKRFKTRILELISYADYLIFKSYVRNSAQVPGELIEKSILLHQFEGFDYVETFKCFIKDELYDLAELLQEICDEECRTALRQKSGKLLMELMYSDKVETRLWDPIFWNSFLEYETNLLEMLRQENGIEKENIKVKLIARMDIRVKEEQVLMSPVTNAHLALAKVLSKTRDSRVLLLMKLLKDMPKEVTYKEIYFLIVLFDANQVVRSMPNNLNQFIEKYQARYPYDSKTIEKRKRGVMNAANKEYVVAFPLDDDVADMIATLESLDIDFKVSSGKVLINSFYFNGMSNVLNTLKSNN